MGTNFLPIADCSPPESVTYTLIYTSRPNITSKIETSSTIAKCSGLVWNAVWLIPCYDVYNHKDE